MHKKNPTAFLDENHKPEMAIALTQFVALCGFRTPVEILNFSEKIPQFAEVLGPDTIQVLNSSFPDNCKIRKCYEAIFQLNKNSSFLDLQNRMKLFIQQNLNYSQLDGIEEFLKILEFFPGARKLV